MIRISNEVTVVADASKFGRRSLSLIGKVECACRVITDDRVGKEDSDALRARGLELVIV
jgi:DeoR family transcriptional regulator, aga operon transcriptional repressor